MYHINIRQINVKKYTKGKAIVTQNDILKPTNKTKINKIISQLCRKFETNVSKTSFIWVSFENVSNTFNSGFFFLKFSIFSEICLIILSTSFPGAIFTSKEIEFKSSLFFIINDFSVFDTSSKYIFATSFNFMLWEL